MKKLLISSVLGFVALALAAAPSQARTFGLFPWHCCRRCCDKCGTICVRPYNAFSPAAWGSMCFDGCNPFCGAGCNAGAPNYACSGYPVDAGAPAAVQGCPAPAAGPAAQAGPVQMVPGVGYAPMMPPSIAPMAAQPQYWTTGYGR